MCDCELIDWGAEDYSSSSQVRARKSHKCIECSSTIRVGETHTRTFQKWDGDVSSHRTCVGCDAWASYFAAEQQRECGCSGWELGRMWEAIADFIRESELARGRR
jgi:hypothetical protein